jgi:hypothetical protein
MGTGMPSSAVPIPLDDDYLVLRRRIRQATGCAYKAAADNLTKKKAALQKNFRFPTAHKSTRRSAGLKIDLQTKSA